MDQGVEVTKRAMTRFEEKNNDEKEEFLDFGTVEGEEIRMLGCGMWWKRDGENRIARARKAWFKLKGKLMGSKMSKSAGESRRGMRGKRATVRLSSKGVVPERNQTTAGFHGSPLQIHLE